MTDMGKLEISWGLEFNMNPFTNLIKKYWKPGLIILMIILGFIFFYEVLPRYNQTVLNLGYNQALNDLSNSQSVPLSVSRQQGNETITKIIPVDVCSDFFMREFNAGRICEVSG